jgi:hypothetical protein
MNEMMSNYARKWLKENLAKLTEGAQHKFKQMYAKGKLKLDINAVVDAMDDEKLDWAMKQVERTLQIPHCLKG